MEYIVNYQACGGEVVVVHGVEIGPRHVQSNGEEATYLRDKDGTIHKVLVSNLEDRARLVYGDK